MEKNKRIILVAPSIDVKVGWLRSLTAALPIQEHLTVSDVMAPFLKGHEDRGVDETPGWEAATEAMQARALIQKKALGGRFCSLL